MSMKLPLSSIWRDDCAKRLSSRSSGGRLSTPGVQSRRQISVRLAHQYRARKDSVRPALLAGTAGSAKGVAGAGAFSPSSLIKGHPGESLFPTGRGLYKAARKAKGLAPH